MAAFDDFVPQFRRARERWPEASTLLHHYSAVTESYDGSGLGIIGSVKSFIECVCRTIIGEFGLPDPKSDSNTTYILGAALKALGLENTRGASRLDDILTAHNKMADALTAMRNNFDSLAHGKDGFLDTLTINECRAYIVTADSILALVLNAYEGKEPDLLSTREPYERFERFHQRIDDAVRMTALTDDETGLLRVTLETNSEPEGVELILEPSKLLYALDRTAYVELLRAANIPTRPLDAEPRGAPLVTGAFAETAPLPPEIVTEYSGALGNFKEPLRKFLESHGGFAKVAAPTALTDSLLATAEKNMGLDWAEREPLQAAMKVALRRTLTRFGVEPIRAEVVAEHLVRWFKEHVVEQLH